jgi:two-component system sensor histidine kinase KdpD
VRRETARVLSTVRGWLASRRQSDPGGGGTGELFPSVAHDLRSALTSIKAASTLLLDHVRDLEEPDKRDMLETIRDGADGLDRLISNAVQLSRSRNGGLRTRKVPAAVEDVASRTLERMRHALRDHRVVVVVPEDLPDVRVDVVLLEQAIGNLLENAARLTPPGTEIALSVLRKDDHVVVRVEDRGPGMGRHQRKRTAESPGEPSAGGAAGLRLPLARAIAEAHGGRLTIGSAPGGGTSVLLELPVERGTAVKEPEPEAAS